MKVLLAITLCLATCISLTKGRSLRSSEFDDSLEGLEDTIVPLGDEPANYRAKRSVMRKPTALSEIMGPLSRRHARDLTEFQRSDEVYYRMRSLLSILKILIGREPKIEIYHYVNWDKTINIDNLFYTRPTSIYQVRRIILVARHLGMRVRATGAGHSRSPLYVDEGNIMMDVRDLERHDGPRMQINPENNIRNYKTLTAMTGVYEYDLNEFMVRNDVTMLSQPLNVNETFGGMVAAATHGSTWSAPTYSGYVRELRLMDSSGRLRRFTIERHPELMKAVICNLGMFGIMYDITIQVYPTLIAKVHNQFVPLDSIIYNHTALRDTVTGNFLTEISWFPFNSVTDAEAEDYRKDGTIPTAWNAKRDFIWLRSITIVSEAELGGRPLEPTHFLPTKGSLSGGSEKSLLRGREAVAIAKRVPTVSYHHLVNAFPVILPPRWGTETSAAFMLNIDNQFTRAAAALQFIIEEAENQIKANGSTPLNALLPRFFENSDCDLCPGNYDISQPDDSNRTLVIDFLAPPAQYGFYPTARKFVDHFRDQKVRPHWGKRHDNIPGIIDHIKLVYGDNLDHFQRMRKLAQVDPCDMFMNTYLIEIFGRSGNWWCA
ncbi:uncharacterized protein LOC124278047 [Haliotis rubra]|uniref:uncharacterized protein LOC124278047 n=1 Tax=Haliotis rubra TaxID=36100 RepID=UPI001EE5283D|nr:uncharacterized protein LOC124278047 [Haliotis rubra]